MAKSLDYPSIKQVSWEDIRLQVKKVNAELFHIIEQLDPSKEYTLFKAKYPYGYESVRRGKLFLPDEMNEKFVSISDENVNTKIRKELSYNLLSNPVSLILKNSFEFFLLMENHTIPFVLASPGSLIGTWVVLEPTINFQPPFLWNLSAGARSIFMLPKISVAYKYIHLKQKFNLKGDIPKGLLDQGKLFVELANSPEFEESWYAEILYFGKKWFEQKKSDSQSWLNFYNYLYKNAWKGTGFMRTEFFWNLVFSLIQKWKNLRPNPYIADNVKHLLYLFTFPKFLTKRLEIFC